jgi:hypothetical protein
LVASSKGTFVNINFPVSDTQVEETLTHHSNVNDDLKITVSVARGKFLEMFAFALVGDGAGTA